MRPPTPLSLLLLLVPLTGCFPNGEWIPTIWGGESVDDAREPDVAGEFVTEDDCTVALNAFVVSIAGGALLAPEGTASAVLPGNQLYDLVQPGPHSMASIVLERGIYPELAVILAPAEASDDNIVGRSRLIGIDNAASDANPSRGNVTAEQREVMVSAGAVALIRGTVTCDDDSVQLDLLLDDDVGLLRCPTTSFEIPGGSFGVTQLVARPEQVLASGADLVAAATENGLVTAEELEGAGIDEDLQSALRDAWEADAGTCLWESGATQ